MSAILLLGHYSKSAWENDYAFIVMLLRLDSSTEWFRLLLEDPDAEIFYFRDRIYFNGKRSNFASILVILNGKHD